MLLALVAGCARVHGPSDASSEVRLDAGPLSLRDVGDPLDRDVGDPLDARRTGDTLPPVDAPERAVDVPATCVERCTRDADCAASCPPNPIGANCCDFVAGFCYPAMVAVCPVSGTCPPCTADADCDACGDPPIGSVHCCDLALGRCHVVGGTSCRASEPPDGGACPAVCAAHSDCSGCGPSTCCEPWSGRCYAGAAVCPGG